MINEEFFPNKLSNYFWRTSVYLQMIYLVIDVHANDIIIIYRRKIEQNDLWL